MKPFISILTLVLFFSCASIKARKSDHFIFWVNSSKVPCEGVGTMNCLKVQKGETINSDNWQLFYSEIEGFEYQPGYIYKLIVKEEKLDPNSIPADASSIKYSLVKVLEKNQDMRFHINDIWVLESIEGKVISEDQTNQRNKIPQIEFNVAEMRVMGNDGCNNFFGSIKKLENKALEFGPLASTKMACMGTTLPDRFNAALNKVVTYHIKDMKLMLLDESGIEILRFKKVD